jgi:hypothetical protein
MEQASPLPRVSSRDHGNLNFSASKFRIWRLCSKMGFWRVLKQGRTYGQSRVCAFPYLQTQLFASVRAAL